ncbi:hypothetical protein BH20ACT5_BH20ACT5_10850 [soil metagenome]
MTQPGGPPPLVAEAMKKTGLVWLAPPGGRPVSAWLLWTDGIGYVVGGPGEQPLPGISPGGPAIVTVQSTDKRARIVTWVAEVTRVEPGTPDWDQIAPQLAAKRLNATGDTVQRWAETCQVLRLTPTGELTEAGPTLPDASHAAAPPSSPATTPYRMPAKIGRRKIRR